LPYERSRNQRRSRLCPAAAAAPAAGPACRRRDGGRRHPRIRRAGGLPEIDLAKTNKVGIFSKLVKLDEKVRDRDRVEIYRPLIADPKEVRRKRAEEGKVTKKGGGDAAPAAAPSRKAPPAA
jgi:uncharacterized protein